MFLNTVGENGKLLGKDYEFAKWVLEIDGFVGMSTAILKDEHTAIITSGPLFNLKDSIVKYSRRNRNCLVSIEIAGNEVRTWLPFVWEYDYVKELCSHSNN